MSRAPSLPVVAAACIVITTPFIVFWRIGDQGYQGPDPDYMIRLPLSESTVRDLGIISLALFLISACSLIAAGRVALHDPETRLVVALMVVGSLLAVISRVATAGYVGANIGGGPVVVLGLPMCIALVIISAERYKTRRAQTNTDD